MNKDTKQLQHLYENTVLNEGLLDRIGTNISTYAQKAKSGVQGAIAGATGNVQGAQAAAQKAMTAKFDSYKKTADAKLEKVFNDVVTDLTKLNLVDQATMKPVIDEFRQNLATTFTGFLQKITNAAPAVAPATTPVAPAPAPAVAPATTPVAPAPVGTPTQNPFTR